MPAAGRLVVVVALKFGLFGVVVEAPKFGRPPLTLWDRCLAGVGARFGACFLNGDSGRGRLGRRGLN